VKETIGAGYILEVNGVIPNGSTIRPTTLPFEMDRVSVITQILMKPLRPQRAVAGATNPDVAKPSYPALLDVGHW